MKKLSLILLAITTLVFAGCKTAQVAEQVNIVGDVNVYEDEYLSFQYPEGMTILREQTGEGRWMVALDWISKVEGKDYLETIAMSNPELRYPYYLEDHDYESWDAFKTDKLALQDDVMVKVSSASIGGQDAVFIDEGGFCEHHYQLYVEGPTGVVYALTAGCVSNQTWQDLYGTFEESVVFKQ